MSIIYVHLIHKLYPYTSQSTHQNVKVWYGLSVNQTVAPIQPVKGRVVFCWCKISTLKPLTGWIFCCTIAPPTTGNRKSCPFVVCFILRQNRLRYMGDNRLIDVTPHPRPPPKNRRGNPCGGFWSKCSEVTAQGERRCQWECGIADRAQLRSICLKSLLT